MTRTRTRIRIEKKAAPTENGEPHDGDLGRVQSDGFTLSFSNGRGILSLNNVPLNDLLLVDRLELVIPNLAFPFDVTGGVSGLKHRRHTLGRIKMISPLTGLEERIYRNLGNQSFYSKPTIVFEDTHIAVLFEFGPENSRVRVGFRLLPWPSGSGLKLFIDEPRAYGPLPVPLLAVIATAIKEMTGEQPDGLVLSVPDPMKAALFHILPTRGWRIPDYNEIALSSVELLSDKALFVYRNLDLLDDNHPSVASKNGGDELKVFRKIEESRITRDGDCRLCEGDVEGARATYTKVLNRDPGSLIAVARLTMMDIVKPELRGLSRLQAAEAFASHPKRTDLAAVVAQGAALAADSEAEIGALKTLSVGGDSLERFAAGSRMGELLFETDPAGATKAYLSALNARREDLPTLSALLRAYAVIGDKERVYALIPRRIAAEKRSENRATAYLEVGSLLLHQMDDPTGAIRYFERAQVSNPKDFEASFGLAESCCKSGDMKRAITQYEHLSRVAIETNDSKSTAKALAALAAIWASQGESDIAISRLREALKWSPEMHQHRIELARLLGDQSRPAEAAHEYENVLTKTKHEKATTWWQKNALLLGNIYLNDLDDPAAAEIWIRQCQGSEALAQETTEALRTSLERQGNFAELAEQLEKEQRDSPSVEGAVRLAEIRIADGDYKQATSYIEQSLDQFPNCDPLLDMLLEASRRSGDHPRLRIALEKKQSRTTNEDDRALLELELGQLELDIFKNPMGALVWLKRAEKNPISQAQASQYLGMSVEKMHLDVDGAIEDSDWETARTLFSVIQGELRGIEKFPALLKEAEAAVQFRDWKTALNAAMGALEGPTSIKSKATKIAARCFIELEAPDEAVRHLEQIAENLDPTEGASALFLASQITEDQLGNIPGAIRLLRNVLEIDPDHGDASISLMTLLEATGDKVGQAERLIHQSSREYSPQKIRYAVNLLIEKEELDRALEVLEALYDQAGSIDDGLKFARLLRENNRIDRLLSLFAKLREKADPIDNRLVEELEILADILESREQFEDAYRVNMELTEHPDPGGARVDQAARIARKVGKIDQAKKLLFGAIESHPEPTRIMRLLSILDPAEDAEELAQVLAVAEKMAKSLGPEDRIALLNAQADLFLSNQREEEGIQILKDIVAIEPESSAAHESLVSIFSRRGKWEMVAELLEKRLKLLKDPSEMAKVAGQLGEILDTKLGDERGAQGAYDKAIAMDPGHQPALKARAAMAYQRQEWTLLSQLNSRIADHPSDTTLLLWNASAAEHCGRDQEAVHLYRRLLDHIPNHQSALDGLARLEQKTDLEGRLSAAFDKLHGDE